MLEEPETVEKENKSEAQGHTRKEFSAKILRGEQEEEVEVEEPQDEVQGGSPPTQIKPCKPFIPHPQGLSNLEIRRTI